jgi:branched-chain amino acid transport system permease protein
VDEFLEPCLNALMFGGIYPLLRIGLTLIFGIMRVVNFTHGELYSFGAYMMFTFVMLLHLNFFLSLALAIALGVALGAHDRVHPAAQAARPRTSTRRCWW